MRSAIFYLICLFLFSCNPDAPVTVGGVKVTAALRKAADEYRFDYTGQLARALAGDEPSIEQLLSFSGRVDSMNAVAHGKVLTALMSQLGDEQFSKITAKLTEENKRTVWAAIESGGTHPLKTAAPLTLQTLLPPKNIQEYPG